MNLKAWAKLFLEHRNTMRKEYDVLVEEEDGFTLIGQEEKKVLVSEEFISEECSMLITLNKPENIKKAVLHWTTLVKTNPLIVFANPSTNEKWLLRPKAHDFITEPESLQEGLLSLMNSIGQS